MKILGRQKKNRERESEGLILDSLWMLSPPRRLSSFRLDLKKQDFLSSNACQSVSALS